MKNIKLVEMSVSEMEVTMGGCRICKIVDAIATFIKNITHAIR